MEETNKDLETQTDANESVEKIETVEETTRKKRLKQMEKMRIRQIIKNEKNGFNFGKIIVPGLIIIILAVLQVLFIIRKK